MHNLRIANVLLLISMLASTLQLGDGQCDFPEMWERVWWESSTATTQFTSNVPGTVIRISGANTDVYTCQAFFEPPDNLRYYVGVTSGAQPTCHRIYHDSNLLVFMEGAYGGDQANFDAEVCNNDTLYEAPVTSIFLDLPPEDDNCFDLMAATYYATISNSETDTDLCATATDTSRVIITDNTMIMRTCSSEAEFSGGKVLTCLGILNGQHIGQPTGDQLIVLSDESQTNTYYCSRIRRVVEENRIYISVDITPSDGVVCQREVSAETAIDEAAEDFRALILTRLLCEPSHGCLNGGTCREPVAVVLPFNAEAYTCDCTLGYTGDRCETFLYCEDPSRCTSVDRGTCSEGGLNLPYTCTCFSGYTGLNCETALICVLNTPCQNGGTCEEAAGDNYVCNCPTGYTGTDCETALVCVLNANLCLNGGTCLEDVGDTYECVCDTGYTGDNCETELVCILNPQCENGATCVEGPGDTFSCNCPNGYTGDLCQTALVCVLNPNLCLNGGTCEEDVGDTYQCNCANGYTGNNCETPLICVLNDPYCQNGGTCNEVDGSDTATCDCTAAYTGPRCETRLNCVPDPCLNNGVCLEVANAFNCVCPSDFTGDICQTPLYCASDPCDNGGVCTEDIGTFRCTCPASPIAYTGTQCETRLYCDPTNPCLNAGTCEEAAGSSNGYSCTCPVDFTGERCETELFCVPTNPCQNLGTCMEIDPGDGYTCSCPDDFTGNDCETRLFCVPNQCQNSGTCVEVPNDFSCNCPVDFTGELCQTELYCVPDPCLNGGTCSEAIGTFSCDCPDSPIAYTGTTCETRLYCTPNNPCLNSGVCVEDSTSPTGYTCICPPGFSGDNCAVEGDCAFPNAWQGTWYIKDDLYVEFTDNKVYYRTIPTGTPISGGSYHCEDFFISTGVGDWRYYVRSLLTTPDTELCVRNYQDENLLVHFDEATGVTADPPTAEECESQGMFAQPPDIMIQYPFDFETTTCFSQYTGQYYATYSRAFIGQNVCSEDQYVYTSTVVVTDNVMEVNTCYTGSSDEPLRGVRLMCVGLVDSRYFGDDLTDSIVILAEYTTSLIEAPRNFYCGRIRNDQNDDLNPRVYLSIDITPRDQLECVPGVTSNTARSDPGNQFRALELMQVFCEPDNPCMNGGTCAENNGIDFSCMCAEGYTGLLCETDLDECASSPCENGGTCDDGPASYTCTCPDGFSGDHCELINGCANNPCMNGGSCVQMDTDGNFNCICVAGYTGSTCQTNIDECMSDPCQNGGTCDDGIAMYTCRCAEGFDGDFCQFIDGCTDDPCRNQGMCRTLDNDGNYECTCLPRFTGDRCETEMYCHGVDCQNGGTCEEQTMVGDYICECLAGYSGRHCEDALFCHSDPCQNGATCNEDTDTCTCDGDWEGRFCDDDGGFNWLIFGIVIGVIGGLILLALLIWGICYCARMEETDPIPEKKQPQSFMQAYPVVTPTYIAASPAPTVIEAPVAQMQAVTYTSAPSIYGTNVRNGMGVSNPPPKISIRRSRPSGDSTLPRQSGPSIIPLAPTPSNGILVNRPLEPQTEGSLMGKVLDAEFYPDVDV